MPAPVTKVRICAGSGSPFAPRSMAQAQPRA